MARPLRIDIPGGWYHITGRGNNRQAIFLDDRDRRHFLELLEAMRERYRVRLHAYVLMGNHYHLLIGTPEANASRAIQWLNQSYSMWHNRRHGLVGHLFQGRFKGILVEGSGWGLELSIYLHMNPVAVKGLGLGKRERKAQRQGMAPAPAAETVARRLQVLREYRWSSYRAYAGYEGVPAWLDAREVLQRVKGGSPEYRDAVEGRLGKTEVGESLWTKVRWGIVLGGEEFARRMRRGLRHNRETAGRRALRGRVTFEEIVRMAEGLKGESWEAFRDRRADPGRDLALWAARQYCGLTLRQLGEKAGGMDYTAVAMAVRRIERRARADRGLRALRDKLAEQCEK